MARTLLPPRDPRKGVPHISYAWFRQRRKRAPTALTWPPALGMGRPRFSKRPPFPRRAKTWGQVAEWLKAADC